VTDHLTGKELLKYLRDVKPCILVYIYSLFKGEFWRQQVRPKRRQSANTLNIRDRRRYFLQLFYLMYLNSQILLCFHEGGIGMRT
jgi:hypothetical protein